MATARAESKRRLDLEIARLRQRLEGAEEMRRAITRGEVDGFVLGATEDEREVVLLDTARPGQHSLLERMQQGALTLAADGEILYANQRFAAMCGLPLAQLFASRLHAHLVARDAPRLDAFLRSGVPDSWLDITLQRGDGPVLGVRMTLASSGRGYAAMLVTDLATRERLEEAESALRAIREGEIDALVVGSDQVVLLSDAHRPYEVMVDRMHQGAVTALPGGEVLYANEQFAAMVGLPRDRVLGTSLERFFAPSDADALRDLLQRPGDGDVVRELALTREDGSTLPVALAAAAVPGGGATTLVLTDLTEHNRHLAIEEEGRRKDEFLGVLGHELRNPLAPIRNAVEILDNSPEIGADARFAVEVIARQTATLSRLVDDLLDVHRLNHGKLNLHRVPTDLRSVVSSALEGAQPHVRQQRHALDVTLAPEPVHVDGDAVRLTQAVLNVVSNAAKYTPAGGTIRVTLERLTDRERGETARIRVVDSGIGIAPDALATIFEPYIQVTDPGEDVGNGLGLGLTVARRLVEMHGGTIRAASPGRGQGSTFEILLPCCPPPEAAAVAGGGSASAAPQRLRILIADDNEDSLQSFRMLLQLYGHEVLVAKDGVEAVELAEAFRPQIAFLDLGMPRLDGFAAARMLRERPWARALALYALSGWSQVEDRQRALDAGFDAHFVKPLEPAQLRELLERSAGSDCRA